MSSIKILALAGSTRRESFNVQLVQAAAAAAEASGAEVHRVDLRDFPLPIFNQDLEREEGTPENALRLKQLFIEHSGLLIASPEYNGSLTPLLKNTLDWVSRPAPDEPPLVAYRGKVAGLMSASPGALGGLRGLVHVRAILGNLGALVLPEQVAVGQAQEAFAAGKLQDAQQQERLQSLVDRLLEVLAKLQA